MLPATATAPLPALDLRLGAKKFVPETKESEREREGGDCKEEVGAFHQNFCPQRSGTTKRERRKAEAKVSEGAGEGTNGAGLFNSCGEYRLNNAG